MNQEQREVNTKPKLLPHTPSILIKGEKVSQTYMDPIISQKCPEYMAVFLNKL